MGIINCNYINDKSALSEEIVASLSDTDSISFFFDNALGVYCIRQGSVSSGSIDKININLFKIFMRYRMYVSYP